MQVASNQECHYHKGEKIIAYCTNYSCDYNTGRCQLCLSELDQIDCKLAHITKLDDMPQYFDIQLQQLISCLTKLHSNSCLILEAQQDIVTKYTEQISSIKEFNNLILDNIEILKKVEIKDLCDIKIKGLSGLIEIKKDIHLSIKQSKLYKIDHSESINTLTDLNQQLNKLSESYFQELITRSFICDEDKNNNLELVKEKINQSKVKYGSPIKAYPQFQNRLQQVKNLIKDQKNDMALAMSLQMLEDYREYSQFQAHIFTEITKIYKLGQKYLNIIIEIDFSYTTEEDRIHRVLSEYQFDIKNYSQSLQHLLKVKCQPDTQIRALYFAQIRFAQIYYKLKDKEKLREKLNQISDIFDCDPCLYYLQAKLSILDNYDYDSIAHKFELSIEQVNTHPMFYLKYIKYLNQIMKIEQAKLIQQRYQQQKFLIDCDHKDTNICSKNYMVLICGVRKTRANAKNRYQGQLMSDSIKIKLLEQETIIKQNNYGSQLTHFFPKLINQWL
ncbi:hypothetical protein pb186bvf_000236 [Paramecium bursaria]